VPRRNYDMNLRMSFPRFLKFYSRVKIFIKEISAYFPGKNKWISGEDVFKVNMYPSLVILRYNDGFISRIEILPESFGVIKFNKEKALTNSFWRNTYSLQLDNFEFAIMRELLPYLPNYISPEDIVSAIDKKIKLLTKLREKLHKISKA